MNQNMKSKGAKHRLVFILTLVATAIILTNAVLLTTNDTPSNVVFARSIDFRSAIYLDIACNVDTTSNNNCLSPSNATITSTSPTIPVISIDQLPAEAQDTIKNIEKGGPFPFPRDGITFSNREGLLPSKPMGYYKEYTVVTPELSNRGPQRIIAGENGEMYYTPDHYRTFQQVIR
jgi:ribonuclease T1